jgi:simple sugar transport system substrate-binding protein
MEVLEDVIAQGIDALCIVPVFPQILELVLRKARKQGIVVISHEASNQRNVDYDLEPFDNKTFGEHMMDHLARYMGEEGEYAIFMGNLTSKSQSEWATAAIDRQREKYPNMGLGMRRIEDSADQDIAYTKTKEILKTIPNLRGILGCTVPTVPGVSRAIEEQGLQDKVVVVGASVVSICKPYLKRGTINVISLWDTADAGYVMNKLAVMALDGETITDGTDLGAPGYTNIKVQEKVLFGSAMIDVTKENMADYNF